MADEWVAEAVVEFLRGPLYINPLMSFIDANCTIWTNDEENRIEYTPIHNEFKKLVDDLLTEFISDLGINHDAFFQILHDQQDKDKLTGFVVNTILTVDDFSLFKTMMVKRNVDLTNQVLASVEAMKQGAAAAKVNSSKPAATFTAEQEQKMLEEVLLLSQAESKGAKDIERLDDLMRDLQIEDEEIAMAMAMANSLQDDARRQGELAELEQAIALSRALEDERLRKEAEPAPAPAPVAKAEAVADPKPDWAPIKPADVTVDPLAPLNIEPNSAADRMSQVAAQAEANARALAAAVVSASILVNAGPTGINTPAKGAATEGEPDTEAAAAGAPMAMKPVFLCSPLKPSEDVPSSNLVLTSHLQSNAAAKNRGAGYKGGAADITSIREAAEAAANTQRSMLMAQGASGDPGAQRWLQEQKLKLVAQKKVEREAEIVQYKAAAKPSPSRPAPGAEAQGAELEAKRAALRDKLAQRIKEGMMMG